MCYKFLIVLVCGFSSTLAYSQGNNLSINTDVPISISVCEPENEFEVTVNNISGTDVTDILVSVVLPTGMSYIPGSIEGDGSEFNVSVPNVPVFAIQDLSSGESSSFEYETNADCGIIAYHNDGMPIINPTRADYMISGSSDYDIENSPDPYNISYASLSITNVTNKSYSGTYGDIFTRTITVTNGGIGVLENFVLIDEHTSGIEISSVSYGTITSSLFADTILLTDSDFSSIGDGDDLFETEEVIQITETVKIVSCIAESVPSIIRGNWGCDAIVCQGYFTTANVNISNANPYLMIEVDYPSDSCVGPNHGIKQQMRITNTGQVTASDIDMAIYQGFGGGFGDFVYSRFDESSFTLTDSNSITTSITPDSLYMNRSTGSYSCLGASPVGGVDLSLPDLAPNESIVINWETYNCCIDNCSDPGSNMGGYMYSGSYFDNCQQNRYYTGENSGVWPNSMWMDQTIKGPTDLNDGESGLFTFTCLGMGVISEINGAFLKMSFELPLGLVWSGGLADLTYYGSNGSNWPADSYNYSGNTLDIYYAYPRPPGFNTYYAELRLNLSIDCGVSGAGGMSSIDQTVQYIQSSSCPDVCESSIYCSNSFVNIHCGDSCTTGGANFIGYTIKRTNFGLADNNNDGEPDSTGSLNLSLIRRDRAAYGDTLKATFSGYVSVSASNPTWRYGYASSDIGWGDQLTEIDAAVKIVDASTGITYNGNATINSPWSGYFTYDFSPATLRNNGSTIPPNFVFEENDSIHLYPRYKVTGNLQWGNYYCSISNEFYLSNTLNPTNSGDMFSCDNYSGAYTLAGYAFNNCCYDYWNVQPCEDLNLYYYIGMYIASYSSGGNFFPYEYRHWGHPDQLKIVIPDGFTFENGYLEYSRTSGTNMSYWDNVDSLMYDNIVGDTLIFNLKQYFAEGGGKLLYSDDGWYGSIRINFSSDCSVADSKSNPFYSKTIYETPPRLNDSPTPSAYSTTDSIFFNPPQLNIEAALPIADGINDNVSWEITIDKFGWSPINYYWLSSESPSGNIVITEVLNLSTQLQVTEVNGVYQLDDLNNDQYRISADYTSCDYDSMIINIGWGCDEYPASVDSESCIASSYFLYIDPKLAELQMTINNPPDKVDLCDTIEYTLEVSSVQIGTAYDLKSRMVLPGSTGLTLVSGSSKMKYPTTSGYTLMPDPVLIAPSTYEWDISSIDTTIGNNGLPGVLDPAINSFIIQFQLQTNCDYISGGVIKFKTLATSSCGASINDAAQTGSPIKINGIPDYITAIQLTIDSLLNCTNTTDIDVKVINLGPDNTSVDDHINLVIPTGTDYVPGSFIGSTNYPVIGDPVQSAVTGGTKLDWQIPAGLSASDPIRFKFTISGLSSLNCGTYYIETETFLKSDAYCVATDDSCEIGGQTGSKLDSITIEKPELILSNLLIEGFPIAPNNEKLIISIDVTNNGLLPSGIDPIEIGYYQDNDVSSTFSIGDILLGNYLLTNSISPGATISIDDTLIVAAGKSCRVIAIIDSNINCVCNFTEVLATDIPLRVAGNDTSTCSDVAVEIGEDAITGYVYSWSPITGLNNSSISNPQLRLVNSGKVASVNEYIVQVNKGGCNTKDTVLITVGAEVVANFGFSDTACLDDPIIFVDSSTSNVTSYHWAFGDGDTSILQSPSHAYSSVGSFTITLTTQDATGCIDDFSKIVDLSNLPVAEAGDDIEMCNGDTGMIFAGGGLNYRWSPVGGLSCSDCQNPLASPTATTIYYLDVFDNNGCVATDSMQVLVYQKPTADAGEDTMICKGDSVQLNGSGNGSYFWTPSTGMSCTGCPDPEVSPPNAIPYILLVTDNNGCKNRDTVIVGVEERYVMDGGDDAEICEGDEVMIGTFGTANYTWSPSFDLSCEDCPQPIASPDITTVYMVLGTNGVCPADTDYVEVIVHPLPYIDAGDNVTIPLGESARLEVVTFDSLIYIWTPPSGLNCVDCKNPIASPAVTTNYFVSVLDSFGCSNTDKVTVHVQNDLCEGSAIFVANAFTPNNDNRNDKVCVRGAGIESINTFRVYSRWGEKVFEVNNFEPNDIGMGWDGSFKGQKLNSGVFVYYVEVICIGGYTVVKKGNITLIR